MNSQDLQNLQEAYLDVYQLDESFADRIDKQVKKNKEYAKKRKPVKAPSFADRIDKQVEQRKKEKDRIKEQVDLYDIILSHLLDEGYAETPEAAEVIMVNMSEDWRESIVEDYKKLPVGKMMWKVSDRAEREADTRAERERQADDPHSTLTYDRARAEHEKAERNKERSNKMIRVADTHSKKAAKAKSKLKKEQVDIYDIILSHLLDEGYAETPEAAEVIMVNMSEDWRESIVSEAKKCWPGYKKKGTQKLFGKTYNRCVKEGKVEWDNPKRPLQSGLTPREKNRAVRKRLGIENPNTDSFFKGGPSERDYERYGKLQAAHETEKDKKVSKEKLHKFKSVAKDPLGGEYSAGRIRRMAGVHKGASAGKNAEKGTGSSAVLSQVQGSEKIKEKKKKRYGDYADLKRLEEPKEEFEYELEESYDDEKKGRRTRRVRGN